MTLPSFCDLRKQLKILITPLVSLKQRIILGRGLGQYSYVFLLDLSVMAKSFSLSDSESRMATSLQENHKAGNVPVLQKWCWNDLLTKCPRRQNFDTHWYSPSPQLKAVIQLQFPDFPACLLPPALPFYHVSMGFMFAI